MVWIALADRRSARFSKISLGAQAGRAATAALPDAAPMLRGSIVAEGQVPTGDRPAHLLAGKGPRFQLSLQVLPSGAGVLVLAIGGVLRHVIVPLEGVRPGDTVRLTYSWDCALGWGRLAAETPMSDLQAMARVPQPQPVTLEQLHQCICGPTSAERDSHLNFVALSCGIEPLGPMPCLTAHVPVETAFGPRPASAIRRGDFCAAFRVAWCRCCRCCAARCPRAGFGARCSCAAHIWGCSKMFLFRPASVWWWVDPRWNTCLAANMWRWWRKICRGAAWPCAQKAGKACPILGLFCPRRRRLSWQACRCKASISGVSGANRRPCVPAFWLGSIARICPNTRLRPTRC